MVFSTRSFMNAKIRHLTSRREASLMCGLFRDFAYHLHFPGEFSTTLYRRSSFRTFSGYSDREHHSDL